MKAGLKDFKAMETTFWTSETKFNQIQLNSASEYNILESFLVPFMVNADIAMLKKNWYFCAKWFMLQ